MTSAGESISLNNLRIKFWADILPTGPFATMVIIALLNYNAKFYLGRTASFFKMYQCDD
jgi:hypothetical protein